MVTLEKLFYQHQYKPLELSTYLSDYLREARSCSFRPEACSKRLYQLFHRFVSKFSSFQDPSLSHLILSISFSVLTYLCETSRDSFATFFEFGLATLLLEELPLSDMTQNENTFSEFISLLHLLCDSYTQTELAQLCHFIVPLLDTILRPSISSRMQVSSLIIKLCDSLSPCVVMRLKSDRSFSTQIVKSGKRIGTLGDIFLQSDVVESIFRLTSKTERAKLSDILFSCPTVCTAFREISEEAFERGSRRFLNTLNASLASTCKVFSYPCVDGALDETVLSRPQELEHLWADFNTSSQNLTLFISHPLDPSSSEWVTVFLRKESFTQLSLTSSVEGFQLHGAISSDKSDICEAMPRSSSSVALRLSFRREHDPSLGMTAALGYTDTFLHLPATSDACKKPPPIRASTSMQAIRILTDSSGTLNTLVAPNDTPVQLEESISPILRSTHEGTRSSAPLTQQTTPVAPIPPIDPLTSTPIRKKNISTPVFTPNNIASVREQTECVLVSASSLHSSARMSIPGSGQRCELPNRFISTNSRKFTPSSLATHVNTPVDIAVVEENSEMKIDAKRANTIKHEIESGEKSLEQRITTVTPQSNTNVSTNDKTRFPDSNIHNTTPRSIRMSSCRRGRHEISRSYKPRAAKVPKKDLMPPSKLSGAPTPMSVDPVPPPIESNEPIQVSSSPCSPLDHNIQNASTTKTLSVSILPIDLTNSEDSPNTSPSPVSVGSKKLALSTSGLSFNQILSPVLMQGKYRRIRPRDSPALNGIETEERNEKKATRVTQTRSPSRQKLSPVKPRPARQRSRKFSPIFTSEESNSPIRKYALTRSQSRNCHLKSPQNQKNNTSGIQGGYIFPAQSFEKTSSNNRNSRRCRKRDSPKITLVSDFPAKRNYKQLSRDSIGSISSSSLLQLQTKNAPLPIRSFSFKSDNSNSSDRMNSLEKHLQQYEKNLKLFSHSLVAIDRSRSERVKKLFVEMKQLMGNENRDVLTKYNDWYHETRNLVAAISEMRQFDLESKSDLHKQFQQAVKQMEHSIQKEQVSAIKKRIHSFFIKI